ncbi:agmatinase [Candidatus Micrarchaeota archaeon]|nr:agmatinase [Candidatus Micrarchaeota archaeon]
MKMLSSLMKSSRPFLGMNPDFESAGAVVLPVPYDRTASYIKGTSAAPEAILDASCQLEEYDVGLGLSTFDRIKPYTLEELQVRNDSPEEMVDKVSRAVSEIVELGKKPVVLGGEHSITAGAVAGLGDSSVSVLQIDAHADMRDSYEGSRFSHACTMRRVREKAENAVQVGIRSMSGEEAEYMTDTGIRNSIFLAEEFSEGRIKDIISLLGENVYVTVDVDGFDPSVMPGTGTPQPGGLQWQEVISLMKAVGNEKKVVGFDITEAVPVKPMPTTEFTVAKLAYRMMGLFWAGE